MKHDGTVSVPCPPEGDGWDLRGTALATGGGTDLVCFYWQRDLGDTAKTPGQVAFESYHYELKNPEEAWKNTYHGTREMWEQLAARVRSL
jgi:hypothetical protein